jgi:hypothetical protein
MVPSVEPTGAVVTGGGGGLDVQLANVPTISAAVVVAMRRCIRFPLPFAAFWADFPDKAIKVREGAESRQAWLRPVWRSDLSMTQFEGDGQQSGDLATLGQIRTQERLRDARQRGGASELTTWSG